MQGKYHEGDKAAMKKESEDSLEDMLEKMDKGWDEWQAEQDPETLKDDPYGLGYIDYLEEQYLEAAKEEDIKRIKKMECGAFIESLFYDYGIDDSEKTQEEVNQVLAELDGEGIPPEIIDTLKSKYHSCFLGSRDPEAAKEVEEETAEESLES